MREICSRPCRISRIRDKAPHTAFDLIRGIQIETDRRRSQFQISLFRNGMQQD
jgi:hypothetical protein